MLQFDTRRITFPIACLVAVVVGGISWWVILPIIVGCFPLFYTLKRGGKNK